MCKQGAVVENNGKVYFRKGVRKGLQVPFKLSPVRWWESHSHARDWRKPVVTGCYMSLHYSRTCQSPLPHQLECLCIEYKKYLHIFLCFLFLVETVRRTSIGKVFWVFTYWWLFMLWAYVRNEVISLHRMYPKAPPFCSAIPSRLPHSMMTNKKKFFSDFFK